MAKQQKGWVYAPSKTKSNPAVPVAFKDEIKRRGDELIESTLKPAHLEPPPDDPQFNYIEQIDCYWRGRYFYFVATYRVAGPNAIVLTFESKFVRMEFQGNSTFNLAFSVSTTSGSKSATLSLPMTVLIASAPIRFSTRRRACLNREILTTFATPKSYWLISDAPKSASSFLGWRKNRTVTPGWGVASAQAGAAPPVPCEWHRESR